jgi:hypothetical protein
VGRETCAGVLRLLPDSPGGRIFLTPIGGDNAIGQDNDTSVIGSLRASAIVIYVPHTDPGRINLAVSSRDVRHLGFL